MLPQQVEKRERFVMCPPQYLSTRIPNNVWMKKEKVDTKRALAQYGRIKNVIESFGTDVLEIPPTKGCQDQTYVANIGIALKPYIILANYKALGRDCEVAPANIFFTKLGYKTIVPPYYFEGEADLKKFKENIYFGGWGQFTDPRAHLWIEKQTGIQIIRLKEINPKLYHLDTSLFVIDEQNIMITKAGLAPESIKVLEKQANLIFTPGDIVSTGITNGVKVPGKKIYLSGTLNPELPDYREAMEWLQPAFDKFGYTVVLLDTDEADKSGADLSCMIFHLNF